MMDHIVNGDNGKYIQWGHRVGVQKSRIVTIATSPLKGNLRCAPPHVCGAQAYTRIPAAAKPSGGVDESEAFDNSVERERWF